MTTFIAPAHYESNCNMAFIDSMLNQTSKDWRAIVIHNGENEELSKDKRLLDPRFEFIETEDSGAWGTYNRITCIENCKTEYIIQSSIQDMWIKTAVEEINKCNEDFLYWNSLNHIFGYSLLDSLPVTGRIDWGNFRVKTEIAKKVGISRPTEFCADGIFVHDLMKSGLVKSIRKINKILTIHN